jgi:Zn ribbon nucleic-acid-binding protein
MREKIAEQIRDIVDGCPYPSPIKCTVGADCNECKTLAILALIASEQAPLREALQCAEYALSHPESNQQFALTAVRSAIGEVHHD